MIPVANITLEDALLDNPNFRANIRLFEGQVFFVENWLVALVLDQIRIVRVCLCRSAQGILTTNPFPFLTPFSNDP